MLRIGIKTRSLTSGSIHWQYKDLPKSETFISAAVLAATWAIENDSDAFSVKEVIKNETINKT